MTSPGESIYFGEAARSFPGPELLQNPSYNPMDHLIADDPLRHPSIASVPGYSHVILRWTPGKPAVAAMLQLNGVFPVTQDGLWSTARAGAFHHGLLQDYGLDVLSYRCWVGEAPADAVVEGPVVYSVVARTEEPPLYGPHDPAGIPAIFALARYWPSLDRRETRQALCDVSRYTQMHGRILPDVEPLVIADVSATYRHYVGHSILTWAEAAGVRESDAVQLLTRYIESESE